MAPISKKCPHCYKEFYISDAQTLLTLYCPFCKAKVYSPDMAETEKKKEDRKRIEEANRLAKIRRQQNIENWNRKSKISEWWQLIVLVSGFFTICNGGPITNLIGWPLLIIYTIENSKSTGHVLDTDSIMIICGAIIWIFNLIMVISIGHL